jgi:hypothetical protein
VFRLRSGAARRLFRIVDIDLAALAFSRGDCCPIPLARKGRVFLSSASKLFSALIVEYGSPRESRSAAAAIRKTWALAKPRELGTILDHLAAGRIGKRLISFQS